jgi:hypothetical protein
MAALRAPWWHRMAVTNHIAVATASRWQRCAQESVRIMRRVTVDVNHRIRKTIRLELKRERQVAPQA